MSAFKMSALVSLFTALGSKVAAEWTVKRMQEKVQKIKSLAGEDNAPEEKVDKKTLKDLIAALDSKETIEITDDREGAKPAKTETKPAKTAETDEDEPAPKPKKAAAAEGESEGAPAKKKAAPKKASDKGPGVIASIIEFLNKATEKKPLTKAALVEKLKERFPEREEDSMLKTVNVQVPNRLKVDKKLKVEKNDKGYWIETE